MKLQVARLDIDKVGATGRNTENVRGERVGREKLEASRLSMKKVGLLVRTRRK